MSDAPPPPPPPPEQDAAASKKSKDKPANLVIPPKKPKLTKAERRALQEAQRAAKAAAGKKTGVKASPQQQQQQHQTTPQKAASKKPPETAPSSQEAHTTPGGGGGGHHNKKQHHAAAAGTVGGASSSPPSGKLTDDKSISLFSHLPPYRDPTQHPEIFSGATLAPTAATSLHPAVLSLGLAYAQGTIRGANARCRAMLHVFEVVLSDYRPPSDPRVDVRHHLDHTVCKPSFTFWTLQCRPHSVSMGNAFSFLKTAVASLPRDMDWADMRNVLLDSIQAYRRERMEYADKAIATHMASKIVPNDVILTYGMSEVVLQVLLEQKKKHSHNNNNKKPFRVIVADARPLLEGRTMLEQLRRHDIDCSYVLLNALSYVLSSQVTKVLLGAAALMSDGSVQGRVGTACVAALAARHHIAVLVCCETYKISNRVQLESITSNELGNPQHVLSSKEERIVDNLRVLNLLYDLTPSQFVSGIVTEMGILPPTSVAVLLREMNPQETDAAAASAAAGAGGVM